MLRDIKPANIFITERGRAKVLDLSRMLVLTPEGKTVRSFLSPVYIADVAWLSNPSGLFFGGAEVTAPNRNQIWFQPYPSGEQSKVTNDLNPYASLSVGGDGKILVATQQRPSATVYVGDLPSVLKDKIQRTFAYISTEQASGYWLSWNAAGKLLQQDGTLHVSVTEADGSSRTPLLESDALDLRPNACGPGDMVVLSRGTTSDNRLRVWRLNTVTGETRRLSYGKGDQDSGSCTPDGKRVVYHGLQESDTRARLSDTDVVMFSGFY